MERLILNRQRIDNTGHLMALCPFAAIEENDGILEINAACTMCKICVDNTPGWVEVEYFAEDSIDKSLWKGIAVYVEHSQGNIHPITYELIGKARELAHEVGAPVFAVFVGNKILGAAEELLYYGVDKIFVYDHEDLLHFRPEPYTAVMEHFLRGQCPSSLLIGATAVGRSLAPRVAARLRTGLTADCTMLEIKANSDLVQIRPAFGGNIMAQIHTPNHRPQLATVRYKVFPTPKRNLEKCGEIISCSVDSQLQSGIRILGVMPKSEGISISEAEVIVVAGRGVSDSRGIELVKDLSTLLGAIPAGTRPLVEAGLFPSQNQIGLSGRTVAPKLIITCGVAGSVQFVAGMQGSECIVAINNDPEAAIFRVAHYGLVGDLYEILPELISSIRQGRGLS